MTIELVKKALIDFLDAQSQNLTGEMKSILQELDIEYYDGYNRDNISAIKFEYEFSAFDLVAYPVDKNYHVAGDIKLLLEDKQYDYFFPDNIAERYLKKIDIVKRFQEEKELIEFKYNSFENWFADCWDKVKSDTRLKGFFSIHDTMWVTNLANREEIREDMIPDLLQS